MDTTTVNLFHDFYFPLSDLIIKLLIGVGVAYLLAKKGFRYKIKEKLYDSYIKLTMLISEGTILRKNVMKKIIAEDLIILKKDDPEWRRKFLVVLENKINNHTYDDMKKLVVRINELLEEISLYMLDNKIYSDFDKVHQYFLPLLMPEEIKSELNKYYTDEAVKQLDNFYSYLVDPKEIDSNIDLDSYFDMVASHINLLLVKYDPGYEPRIFLGKVKKAIAAF